MTTKNACPGTGHYQFTCSHPDYVLDTSNGDTVVIAVVVIFGICVCALVTWVLRNLNNNRDSRVSNDDEITKL